MSRFNIFSKAKSAPDTINRAGGEAYRTSAEYRLASLMLTSFVTDQFYRDANGALGELMGLIAKVEPGFAARAAIYARKEYGMRTITHAAAALLSKRLSGHPDAKAFYDQIVVRPDDMLEIRAALKLIGERKLTNAMKKGFAAAFDRFDGYQIAKYRADNKDIKLVDMVNLVHPVPTQRNAAALQALVDGTLTNTETWEAKLSAAGAEATSDKDKAKRKASAWADLLRENKLGYFALLRNLRNIIAQAPKLVPLACEQLVDEKRLRGSKVLPFRLLTAYKQFAGTDRNERKVLDAIERAADLACANMPQLDNTLVVIDNSGSMACGVAGSHHVKCNETGALFGFALAKRSGADLMEFGTSARMIPYRNSQTALDFAMNFEKNNKVGHGTDFKAIFGAAKRKYDRIVIFSDMQGWKGGHCPKDAFSAYRKRTGADPFLYSVDLAGYGSLQFPEDKVATMAGFSEKIFEIMAMAETDSLALINRVRAVEL
ncbi:TROVE domain-containing protein [Neolewinella aurantiaca]|uniref:TROVE domain-containing protein n=1 Tax=Neolewinella aurantiaca TaxID=2602767 RepID=A0A5C7G063_9BACT|nr:TROVE domain-containing protein [Neolewinella aurantiaca]TXF91460.1 TROVE domain-containing protein [Neolewinella aurantiaca]